MDDRDPNRALGESAVRPAAGQDWASFPSIANRTMAVGVDLRRMTSPMISAPDRVVGRSSWFVDWVSATGPPDIVLRSRIRCPVDFFGWPNDRVNHQNVENRWVDSRELGDGWLRFVARRTSHLAANHGRHWREEIWLDWKQVANPYCCLLTVVCLDLMLHRLSFPIAERDRQGRDSISSLVWLPSGDWNSLVAIRWRRQRFGYPESIRSESLGNRWSEQIGN